MKNKISFLRSVLIVFGMLLVVQNSASAQGRGNSGGAGRGNSGAGRPSGNPGVDRGLGNASGRSNRRSDEGLNTADERSNGRSGEGLERTRSGRENVRRAEREVRNNPQTAQLLGTNANDLRQAYQAALNENPDLKFGQFVAANMLARNLGLRNPNVTTAAILNGLINGDSIGQTLKMLGVSLSDAKDAELQINRLMKENKNRN